jgi:hypothetical protein
MSGYPTNQELIASANYRPFAVVLSITKVFQIAQICIR